MSGCADIDIEPAGYNSYLSFEQSDSIIGLPILKYDQKRVTATSSWDSSIHDSVYLNRVTQNTERVYVILKVSAIEVLILDLIDITITRIMFSFFQNNFYLRLIYLFSQTFL